MLSRVRKMIRAVSKLPEVERKKREPFVAQDIREFARNKSLEVCELVYKDKKPHSIILSARLYLKKYPDKLKGIKAVRRGEHIYLVREHER